MEFMMLVGDILTLAKIRLGNLAIGRDTNALINIMYLGIGELYNRFNLSIKSETIITNPNTSLYELKNDDVSLFLNLFDSTGRYLSQTDVLGSLEWDYKMVNYRSFILKAPKEDVLYAIYKASPTYIRDKDDFVDLPDAMVEALLAYMCYMANGSITGSNSALNARDNINYYQIFNQLCMNLENQGYKVPLSTETLAIQCKGYR